jgi:hypothetical protein
MENPRTSIAPAEDISNRRSASQKHENKNNEKIMNKNIPNKMSSRSQQRSSTSPLNSLLQRNRSLEEASRGNCLVFDKSTDNQLLSQHLKHFEPQKLGIGQTSDCVLQNNYGMSAGCSSGSASPERDYSGNANISNKESLPVGGKKRRRFSLQATSGGVPSSLLNDSGQPYRPMATTISSSTSKGVIAKKIASNSKGVFADTTFQRMR